MCNVSASVRCAGRRAVRVRARAVVYVVKRMSWNSDVLPHATVNMAFWCIIGKDGRTGTNPGYSMERDPTKYTE